MTVNAGQHVAMNKWGLPPKFLDILEARLMYFLQNLDSNAQKAEHLLPRSIDRLFLLGEAKVTLLETENHWFDVTYKENKPVMLQAIKSLIEGTCIAANFNTKMNGRKKEETNYV